MSTTVTANRTTTPNGDLSTRRRNVMRLGYLFMGGGLVVVKWPQLPDAHTLPLYESVTLCLLVAMSLLALLGLRYPVKLLPVLLLEVTWKILWLTLVGLPTAITDGMDRATSQVAFNCAFVVVIIAVVPWRYVWRQYVRGAGERWR